VGGGGVCFGRRTPPKPYPLIHFLQHLLAPQQETVLDIWINWIYNIRNRYNVHGYII
jgi:hypothetical protein